MGSTPSPTLGEVPGLIPFEVIHSNLFGVGQLTLLLGHLEE